MGSFHQALDVMSDVGFGGGQRLPLNWLKLFDIRRREVRHLAVIQRSKLEGRQMLEKWTHLIGRKDGDLLR